MKKPSKERYSIVIVHQFDPENEVIGGVDTCIRGLLRGTPRTGKVLLIGTSETRQLQKLHTIHFDGREIAFVPVSRLNAGDQKRIVPHGIRMIFGARRALREHYLNGGTLQIHRIDYAPLFVLNKFSRIDLFLHTNLEKALSKTGDSFWKYLPRTYTRLLSTVIRRVDKVVVFSKSSADQINHLRSDHLASTTWFNPSRFTPNYDSVENHVIWVGRLETPKDPFLAFTTLTEVMKSGALATIIGDGTMSQALARRASSAQQPVPRLTGSLSQVQVAKAMREASVLLSTSHFEGSPLTLFEALASGTPVVATSEADPDELIQDGLNGYRAKTRTHTELAQLVSLATQLDRRKVAETVSEFTEKKTVEKIWRYLEH